MVSIDADKWIKHIKMQTQHLNHKITLFKQSYAANGPGPVFYTYIWDCFTETTDESEGEIKLRPQETRKVDFF